MTQLLQVSSLLFVFLKEKIIYWHVIVYAHYVWQTLKFIFSLKFYLLTKKIRTECQLYLRWHTQIRNSFVSESMLRVLTYKFIQ